MQTKTNKQLNAPTTLLLIYYTV